MTRPVNFYPANESDGGINTTEHQTYEARLIFGINF